MPYIGKSPVGGGFHKLDNLTASSTATYALTLSSAAYYPETANQLLVSLNGVIQAPQDSFTVSGSNLIFDSALTASDSIDFVVALGDVLGVQGVTDGAVSTAKIGNGAVTDAKLASTLDLSAKALTMPTGAVLQVVQGLKTDSANTNSTSFTNTGLSASITPSSASSKILIMVNTVIGQSNFQKRVHLKLDGGNTSVYIGDAGTGVESAITVATRVNDAYGLLPISMQYLDSPATTSAITYNVQWRVEGDTAYMNRPATLDSVGANTASTIILQEIAG
jgi:hypothetical protein